jgi:arylsulfatase
VTTGDGHWKLQLPHTFQTLAGKPGGTNGVPAPYSHRKIEGEELYDLVHDIAETTNVAQQHPEIVKRLEAEVEKARADLGDALTKRPGSGRREPGRISQAGTKTGK